MRFSKTMFIQGNQITKYNSVKRAGAIPFTISGGDIHFLLGVDRRTRELTDFGGGVKSHESPIEAALRELQEESCTLFQGSLTEKNFIEAPAVTNNRTNTVIFFLYIDSSWLYKAEEEFRSKQRLLKQYKKYNELQAVKWFNASDFETIVFNPDSRQMWRRIQNILCSNTTWQELVVQLLLGPELTHTIKTIWYGMQSSQLTQIAITS